MTTGLSAGGSAETTGDADGLTGGMKLDVGAGTGGADSSGGDPGGTGVCAASTLEGSLESIPVDIILVVDTSSTMNEASAAVEASINGDFAQILEESGIDYQVIVLASYGSGFALCLEPPLAGAPCDPLPADPAVTNRYLHYDSGTGSEFLLQNILTNYNAPDQGGYAPNGWSEWLRQDSRKVFLAFTDSRSTSNDPAVGHQFDNDLFALDPLMFGTADDRRYVFHAFMGIVANSPASEPWLPTDPLSLNAECGSDDEQGPGGSIQQVAILSGGLRFPVCHPDLFGVVFEEVAQDVVASTPVACSFPIPLPPAGETLDPTTLEVDILQGGMLAAALHQVVDAAACETDAFYVQGDTIHLCPLSCDTAQSDLSSTIEVRYGCDVGFVPAG
jgi:hypothetical protein